MMNLNLKKILIIDDDLIVLETIAALLENELVDIEIIKISNPKIALEFIQKNGKEIQVIISDVRMPDYNGAYLAKAALEINSQMRFFLMTGHLNLLEQLDLLFIGIEKVFLKPFDVSEIIVELNKEPTEISFINSKMVPLKISQLKQKKTYPFDIYISLSDNKSIKIFPANEEVDEKRLDQLASKNLTVLFANKEDALLNGLKLFVPIRSSNLKLSTELNFKLYYQKKGQFKLLLNENTFFDQNALNVINSNNIKCLYIEDVCEESFRQYLDKYLKEFMTSKTIKSNEKIETLNDVIGNKLNNIANNPNIENINSLKESINSLQNFLENDKGAIDEIVKLNDTPQDIRAHSTIVASLSYSILLEIMRMRNRPETKNSISALNDFIFDEQDTKDILFKSALLHDIGIPLVKTQSASPLEHVNIANEKLKHIPGLSPKIVELVYHHEEFNDGSGPLGIKRERLNYLSQVLSIANYFDHLKRNDKCLSTSEALNKMTEESIKFNRHLLKIFESLFRSSDVI